MLRKNDSYSFAGASELGLRAVSTADEAGRENYTDGYVQIAPRAYNSDSGSFDRPWPFGPESGVM